MINNRLSLLCLLRDSTSIRSSRGKSGIYKGDEKVKVKWSRYRPGLAHRVGRCIALLFHHRGTRRGWVFSSTPRPHFTPRERPGTHWTGGWVGPIAGLDGWKISSPTGIRSQTIQPVVSHYTDWATRPIQRVTTENSVKDGVRKAAMFLIEINKNN